MNRAVIREHPFSRTTTFLVLSQVGLGLRSSFLDRPSVMVLVPGQGRTAGEGLLAIGVGTLVRSLSGVDAAVPSK